MNSEALLEQSTEVAKRAADLIGGSFTQAKGFTPDAPIADADKVGSSDINIPTDKKTTPRATELDMVGTTPSPKTGLDVARQAILDSVNEEDRDTISSILDVSTNLQTERGRELESQFTSLSEDKLDLAERRADRQREGLRLMDEKNLPELEAELESIRSEADVLEARRNAAVQAEAGRDGVSTTAQQGNINAINKDFNLQKANLAIRELASVGKINAATKLIDTKLDIKYGDIEAETELVRAQLEAILPLLNREDAKVANARLLLNEQVKAKMTEAREADKALEEFKLQSYLNAQRNGASTAVLSQIMSSDSREDVASVGGAFIEDPTSILQRENMRLQNDLLSTEIDAAEIAADLAQQDIANGVLSEDDIRFINQTPQGKKLFAQQDLGLKLANYRSLVEEFGLERFGGPNASALDNAYTELQLAYKEAANLGVLNGPDLVLIEKAIKPATGIKPQRRRRAALEANLNEAMGTLASSVVQNYNQLINIKPSYANSNYVQSFLRPFSEELVTEDVFLDMDKVLNQ